MEENNKYLIRDIAKVEVESFNYFLSEGIHHTIKDVGSFSFSNEEVTLNMTINAINIASPSIYSPTYKQYPNECREAGLTYGSPTFANMTITVNGETANFDQHLGRFPIMLRSEKCRLHGLSQKELIAHHEDALEQGGYFVIKGNDKLLRLLVGTRANQPHTMVRGA
eukprot:TRINITY_DN16123_c0_g1_i1.p1 TRINITY_DN16123_c0_g1~~TRINITY_DN16123_c0_g1_i1.p1  ORF type:complete len:167 (-),score=31.20 TRINITY_DN16123_c0_g1_i1:101-601(-)